MPIATTQSDFRNHIKDYLDKVNSNHIEIDEHTSLRK